MNSSDLIFRWCGMFCGVLDCAMGLSARTKSQEKSGGADEEQLLPLVRFTARTLETAHSSPFGAAKRIRLPRPRC